MVICITMLYHKFKKYMPFRKMDSFAQPLYSKNKSQHSFTYKQNEGGKIQNLN